MPRSSFQCSFRKIQNILGKSYDRPKFGKSEKMLFTLSARANLQNGARLHRFRLPLCIERICIERICTERFRIESAELFRNGRRRVLANVHRQSASIQALVRCLARVTRARVVEKPFYVCDSAWPKLEFARGTRVTLRATIEWLDTRRTAWLVKKTALVGKSYNRLPFITIYYYPD